MAPWMILLVLAGPLLPTDASVPRHFYNRPGATDAERAAEIERCRAIGQGNGGHSAMPVPGPADSPERFPRDAASPGLTLEACMATRGWRFYALSPRERSALQRLSPTTRRRAIQSLSGAKRPAYGQLVRDAGTVQLHDPGVR